MSKKNTEKEKVIYLFAKEGKKAPMVNLYSLPTKCPVCNVFQEPKLMGVQFNDYKEDARIQFSCTNKKCKSLFSTLYMKGRYYGNEQYHFISFL